MDSGEVKAQGASGVVVEGAEVNRFLRSGILPVKFKVVVSLERLYEVEPFS